ncbi:hypothetical protein LAM22_20295, partial [Mycobacterium tuberculosis]|nr:hypothetical protein [Mycobacterium tuberculosis]
MPRAVPGTHDDGRGTPVLVCPGRRERAPELLTGDPARARREILPPVRSARGSAAVGRVVLVLDVLVDAP